MKKRDWILLLVTLLLLILIILVIYLSINSQITGKAVSSNGKTWYVSKNGNNANGQSWSTAWSEMDQIEWNSISPGDTIYLDSGSSSMAYNTLLEVQKSGTASAPITIKRTSASGHNGVLTMNAQIKIFGSYINFDGLDNTKFIKHSSDSMCGFFIGYWDQPGEKVSVSGITFDSNYETEYGVSICVYTDNDVVRNCKFIRSPGEDPFAIQGNPSGNILIENNEFTGLQDSGTGVHRDVISSFGPASGKTLTIRGNYFHDSNTDTISVIPSQGAVLGRYNIYNNTFWNLDRCAQFDTSRMSSMQGADIHDNIRGDYNTWITDNNGGCSRSACPVLDRNNQIITSRPNWKPGLPTNDNNPPPATSAKAYSSVYFKCDGGYSQTRNAANNFRFCLDEKSLREQAKYVCKSKGTVTDFRVSSECTPPASISYTSQCSDNDGFDVYTKGTSKLGYTSNSEYCWDGTKKVSSGPMIAESWCSLIGDGLLDYEFVECENGCSDGKCVL